MLMSNLDLDLVPPVHLCTSGSSLSPFQPVLCCVFNFLPCDPNPFQVLLKCPTPCHPWASSSSCATCWSPRYCSSRRLVVAVHALPYGICAQSQCLLVFSSRSCVRSLHWLCGPCTSLVVSFSDIASGTHSASVQFLPSSSMFHRRKLQ